MTYKKLAAMLLIVLIALSMFGAVVNQSRSVVASPIDVTGAQNTWSRAPTNPAFAQYLKNRAAGTATTTVSGHEVGLVPSTVDFSTLTGQSVRAAVPLVGASSSYDLRGLGKVSPVKDQGTTPACWAFASYGSLESYLLPTQWSFSENNMKNLAGFDLTCNDGGNPQMATAYLARWGGSLQGGPVATACDPFSSSSSCTDQTSCSIQQHVQNVLFLPYRGSSADNDNIKSALRNYGGVYASFYVDTSSSYYNSQTAAYYYSGSNTPNHSVTIVGWNDSYPASNFAKAPPGPGAFIAKNSWGTGWGQQGFFYISYYDTQFATNFQPPTVFTAEPTTNYDTNYQYDPLGWVGSYGVGSTQAWGANVFTATSNQQLSAVSFYASSVDTQYEIFVYTDPTSGPIGGTGYTGPAGTIAIPGYHTIPLTTPVPLTAGHKFSVVIKITTPGNNQPIPVESALDGYSSATAQPGQSYLSATGTSWTDATREDSTMNVCIKAFATTQPTQLSLSATTTTPAVNEQVTFTANLTTDGTTPISGKSVTIYHLSPGGVRYNDTNAPTGSDGKVTFKTSWGSFGKRPYYATFAGDSTYASQTSKVLNITVGATQLSLSATTTTPAVNQKVTFTANLTTDGTTPISGKSVTIYHLSPGGVRYNDTTATTVNGKITVTTSWGSTGIRPYYATFAGDSSSTSSTSPVVNVNVHS